MWDLVVWTAQIFPFLRTNDPRESKDWSLSYRAIKIPLDFDESATRAELNRHIKHGWRIGCFSEDVKEACAPDIFRAPFERGHSRSRMWAQYAESHGGACLVFYRAKLDDEIKQTAALQGRRVYADRGRYEIGQLFRDEPDPLRVLMDEVAELGVPKYAQVHIERHWRELFLVKEREWTQERECRWIVEGGEDEFFHVDIRASLVGLLIGDRFPKTHCAAAREYALANDLNVAVMGWQNGVPQPRPVVVELLESQYP